MNFLKNTDRRLITILLIVFIQMLGGAMVLPVLPLYAQRDFGLSAPIITLLVSSYFIALFFAGPWLGRLSDTRGRLPILVISLIGTVLSFILMALANRAWMLFAARILDGITGGNIIVAQAYVTDITPREQRTEKLGKIFAVFGLGFIFGPALGG
ncbi:MAG TPA: MFS transporter, partial [Anaerolineales bacterium]|nr:MFS transporter [Anaerolineales bacterium]